MAELYENPKHYVTAGGAVGDSANGIPTVERMLAELPPEEREEAMKYITAPPSGEEIMRAMQEKNSRGEVMNMTLDQYRLFKAHNKSKEVDVIAGIGEAAGTVFDEVFKAAGSIVDDPTGAMTKLTPSVVEAFAQGTRNLYGMAAQSADPNSVFFRMKNALQANGDDEQAEYQQFMEAQAFNVHSMRLMTGQDTIIMDKDIINPEMTQVMSYIADPTLFIPFGGVAAKGATMIGMGEKLAMAGARTQAIRNMVLGGAIKWGVGAPLEFMGGAIRNTIDYGIETGSRAIETATGVAAKDIQSAARVGALGTTAGSALGLEVNSSVSAASRYYTGSLIARNVGEAASIYGEQMMKQGRTGRGVLGYAGQAIRDTERAGIKLTPQTKSLLKAIEAVDPLFVYADDIAQGAAQGAIIGGGLGYLAGGEEGMAGGIGSGIALGAIGAGAGKVVADVTGNTKIDQMAIQRKLIIEALKENGNENAIGFEAMAAMAEATGDRAFQGYIDGIIAGIDTVNPDSVFKAFNTKEYKEHLTRMGIDPDTGVLREKSRIFPELNDRTVKADVLGVLRDTGNRFAGDPAGFERAIKNAPEFAKLKPVWSRLDDNAKAVVLKQIKDNGDPAFVKGLKGRQLNAHWGDLAYSERLADMINTLNQKNSNSVPDKIRETLKAETRSDKKLTRRGQMLKEKLQADGYIDKDGNIRQRRLTDVEGTQGEFDASAGWAKTRDSTGRTEVVINLDKWAMDSGNRLSLAHELYHSIMMESVFAPDYIDRLSQKLLGKFDPKTGRVLEPALVPPDELMKFFGRYIDNDPNNRGDAETIKRKKEELKKSIEEYRTRGTANRVADATAIPLEHLVEEFGAYYFSKWVKAQPIDYMFRGGEFGGIRGLMEMASDGWLDYWKGKIGENNPNFNFDAMGERGVSKAFERDGKRVSSRSLDLFMRDIVRIEANRNSNNGFDVNKLSKESREWFLKVNGLRGAAFGQLDQQGNVKRPKLRRYTAEEIRQGKEMFKVLESLPDAAHKDGMRRDGDGNWSGMPNTAQINALVGAGYIQRAWFDRMMRAYDIVNGNGSNVVEFGYLGYSAHIGDGNERVYGAAVPFKNRRAVLIGVDFKVRADGTVFSNLHTLDLKVIEARGNEVWKDPQTRELWKGSRTDMEADFYAYLSNASLPSDHPNRKPSAKLLDKGDGLGGQRRDALHQMLGFHKGSDLPYINRPIAEIPVGIRHSVTTFSNDGIVNMRVDNKPRYDFNFENAHLDLSRNFMPSEMTQENTPSGGKIVKHATGYQISKQAGTKFKVFDPEGKHLGDFDTIADAGRAAQKHFNESYDKSVEGKDPTVPRTEVPPSRQAYIEKGIDISKNEDIKNGLLKFFEERAKSDFGGDMSVYAKDIAELNANGVTENILKDWRFQHIEINGRRSKVINFVEDYKSEIAKVRGAEYDAMYPMEIKSALHGQLAQIFQDHPNITAQGLLKKLVTYGSRGSRFFQEATEIGLVDMLKAKIQRTTSPMRMEDGRVIQMPRGGETQPRLDMAEILDFAKSKEIRVTIEEGAREVNNLDTSQFTLGGTKDNYKQTAIRINPEYAHGIRGHYGENTIVHFRTTERIDADGNRHLFIEEVQANNTDKKSGQTEADTRKLKRDEASLPVLERIFQEGKNRGLFTKYDNLGYEQNGYQSSVRVFFQSIEQKQQDGDLRKIFLENRETLKRFLGDSDIDTAGLVIESHFYRAVDDHYRHILNNADLIKKWELEIREYENKESSNYRTLKESNETFIREAKERILNSEKEVKDSFENVILGDRTPPANSKIPAMTDAILSIPELKEYFNAAKELAVKVSDFQEHLINSSTNEVAGLVTYAMNPHHLEATISDIKTRIQQAKAVVKPLPLTAAKDWTLTALKGIIRQAIRDGLDRVTLTHPDDSPTVSHMAKDARQGLYGKLIPEVWGSWLRKYGIEITQPNKLTDVTLEKAKAQLAEMTDKIHEANKKVLSRFEQVGSKEDPNVINRLSEFMAMPVQDYHRGRSSASGYSLDLKSIDMLVSKIDDVELRNSIRDVVMLKATESSRYDSVLRYQEKTVSERNGGTRSQGTGDMAVDARISEEALDRGMTFELNDRIKREFLEGRINTHSMPSEGGFDFEPNSNKASKLLQQYLYGLKTGKSHQEMMTPELDYVFKNIEQFTKASNDDIINAILKLGDNGSAIVERFKNQEITLKQATEAAKNIDDYTYNAKLKDIRDARKGIYNAFMRATGQMRKISDKDGRRYNTDAEREHRNTGYQPSEEDIYSGGRVYDQNSKQFKSGFVGLYAAENPDRVKGISLQFMKRADGSHRIRLTDNSKKGESADIGHITANIEGDRATLSSHINEAYRGKKLAYVVYSEMAERLRAMGVTAVDGQIVNRDGVPIKVRERIIGDTRDLYSGRRINHVEGANRIRDKQEIVGSMGGIDVTNTLYKQGRYMPSEDWSKTVADAQRDKPESAMVKVQYKLGGGLMSTVIEQAGDILHRTYERMNINNGSFGYETVKYKVDLALRRVSDLLLDKDEFRRNVVNNWNNNKNSTGTPEQHLVEVKKLLKEFGDAHAELPANNELQRRVKALNVALGDLNFSAAHSELEFLRKKLVNEKSWTDFAKEGMSDKNRPAYMPAEGEQGEPVRLSGKMKTVSTKKVSTNQYEMGEGNRTYDTNSRQWTNGFIGRYAEENPILTKGVKLSMKNWDKRTDDYGRRSIELKEGNKLIGRIDYEVKKGSGGKWMLFDPTVRVWEKYRGKGYSNLLYSEMAERARFLGAEDFLQRIENEQALPMFSQVKTFGFGESKLIDAGTGKYYPPTKENFDKLKKPLVEIHKQDGSVESMEGYEPWVHSWSKIFPDRHYMPSEGTNAPVNKENRNFILNNIKANANSLRAFEEGQKSPEERSQNYITIDNINPDLLRGEAVVMHSPDNAGVEPVQIGRFTVHPRGGMRYPSENPTQGWAGVKAGLGKQINDNGNYNAEKGYGWASAVGLIKGENSKMKGTHIGLEVFLRNLQNFTDNKVLTEKQTIQILKNGLGDIGDTKRPLDTIVEDILAKSAKHEGKYTIDGRRKAIEKMTKTDGSASLWKYLQSNLTSIEPHIKGFSSEGVTNANQFIKAILEPMYEAVSDPLTRHAKVGEVYGYLVFRSPVEEPKSNIHPSYKYSVQPLKGGSPVQLDILSTPMNARNAFTNRITAGKVSPLPVSEKGFAVSTGQKHIPTMRGTFMPAEYTEFKSEQSPMGRIMRNAKGYVITMANNKFRVYNPAKAIIGVYNSEDEAKKRIYREIPKQ